MPPTFSVASTLVYDQVAGSRDMRERANTFLTENRTNASNMDQWQNRREASGNPRDTVVDKCIDGLDKSWLDIDVIDGRKGTAELTADYIDEVSRYIEFAEERSQVCTERGKAQMEKCDKQSGTTNAPTLEHPIVPEQEEK